jgi:5-methylcytosine-specific restriction endonuclease McrA
MAIKGTVHSTAPSELCDLGDADLVAEVGRRAGCERQATADLIRALIEFDRRRLYLGEGYSSLFAYCTSVLHYSEHGAFNRIEVARAAARWPQLLACLEDGSLHLAGARLLAPHLTAENIDMALEAARHKSKREIEEVAAGLARRAMLIAVAAEQYRLHLTISGATRDKLRQVQALLSHQLPDGNPAVIFDRALEVLLAALERQRLGATKRPRAARARKPRARRPSAAVRREVWARDEARCAFIGKQGRCNERKGLEFHHVKPYAKDGPPTANNIELRCRAHNVYEAEVHFGPQVIAAARARRQGAKGAVVAETAGTSTDARGAAELVPGRVESRGPGDVRQPPPAQQLVSGRVVAPPSSREAQSPSHTVSSSRGELGASELRPRSGHQSSKK